VQGQGEAMTTRV